jgi:DNA-binding transcriptional MerR regulator
MNKVTTKTLRYYDEIGLFKPIFVDEITGYRYYSSEQLLELNKIIALRQMGLRINDIRKIISQSTYIEAFLKEKEKELEDNISGQQNKLLRVKNYIKRLEGGLL